MCQHEDEDSRKVLLTGYQRIDDREIIKKINHSEKLNVAEHHALIQRLRNRSYTDPVYLTTEELSDQKLRSAGLRSVWIKFPSVGDNFVGWDYCSKCSEVRFLNVSQNDLRIIEKSVKVWKFDNCRSLTITHGHGFDFTILSRLFPGVETIVVQRTTGISLDGLSSVASLKELWVEHCTQQVALKKEHIPPDIDAIVFYRSVDPLIYDEITGCSVITDDVSKDEILRSL